jgi:hypothetical protein
MEASEVISSLAASKNKTVQPTLVKPVKPLLASTEQIVPNL